MTRMPAMTDDLDLTATPARRRRWLLPVALAAVAFAAFVLVWFQPQKLFIDERVDEALPGLSTSGTPSAAADDMAADDMAADDMAADDMAADDMADETATTVERAGPVQRSIGSFSSLDHPTSGSALVVEREDGSRILRFEDLVTDNGPDLRVVLSTAPVGSGDYGNLIELGALKGNLGNQNYEIPADVDLSSIRSVVIWCERFSSPFGEAPVDVM
jgi:hypothetical protein